MDVESDAEEENEEGISMEYFEPEDVKYSPPPSHLHGSQLQEDPIIEISSDSEEEEDGPSQGIGRLSGPTPRLTGLNERQQTALLELGMNFLEDSPASGLHDSASSAALQKYCLQHCAKGHEKKSPTRPWNLGESASPRNQLLLISL